VHILLHFIHGYTKINYLCQFEVDGNAGNLLVVLVHEGNLSSVLALHMKLAFVSGKDNNCNFHRCEVNK
jgi:hypothetical protein